MEFKKKIFGIPMMLIIIGMIGLVGVSAALVGYLSNTVKVDVKVISPMVQSVSGEESGWIWVEEFSLGQLCGGESTTFYVKTENLADASITGYVENIVTNPEGVTCDDFDTVEGRTRLADEDYPGGYGSLGCETINSTSVKFTYAPEPMTWTASQIDISEIVVTFEEAASGDYVLTSRIIPAPITQS